MLRIPPPNKSCHEDNLDGVIDMQYCILFDTSLFLRAKDSSYYATTEANPTSHEANPTELFQAVVQKKWENGKLLGEEPRNMVQQNMNTIYSWHNTLFSVKEITWFCVPLWFCDQVCIRLNTIPPCVINMIQIFFHVWNLIKFKRDKV